MAESMPEDIVVDILLRLPAKSLVRFKCVCKRWRSLISDRAFAKSHLQRLKAGDLIPSQRFIVGGCNGSLKTVDYEALDDGGGDVVGGEGRMVVPLGIKPSWELRILGTCDGLVCLLSPSNFVIYNPTTRECIELPDPNFVNFVDRSELFGVSGFGYDSQSDDYKLVAGAYSSSDENWKLAIFSLNSGSWRSIEVPFQEEFMELVGQGVYWKGALHWHVYVLCMYDRRKGVVMSFDLLEEKFHEVLPVPVPEFDEDICLLGLGIHGANLFIYNCTHDGRIEGWITDEYGREASWTKLFSVDCSAIINLDRSFEQTPLAYTRSGKIVIRMDKERMIMFNPEDNTCKDYLVRTDVVIEYAIYLETLVSPYVDGGAAE